ncbi:veswaprin-c-like [Pleurodeles waltl]|uniref:veswaprin-c-like n=1 Tax=Pleurodeles waltl TaxID=8319 RepID=UPI0037098136
MTGGRYLLLAALTTLWRPNSVVSFVTVVPHKTGVPANNRTVSVTEKPGFCPELQEGALLVCDSPCDNDQQCEGVKKCCDSACGYNHCKYPQDEILTRNGTGHNETNVPFFEDIILAVPEERQHLACNVSTCAPLPSK